MPCDTLIETHKCPTCFYETMWLINLHKHLAQKSCYTEKLIGLQCPYCRHITTTKKNLEIHKRFCDHSEALKETTSSSVEDESFVLRKRIIDHLMEEKSTF